MELVFLNETHTAEIVELTHFLNPKLDRETLILRQQEMFAYQNYVCFGLRKENELIAVSGAWITVRYYSGKQLEVDHVVVSPEMRSSGLGAQFFELIEAWARENGILTVELNTYVANSKSHRFYFKQGYKILGFHFQKKV